MSHRFFSQRTYAAPFGRYEAGNEAESPADEVLVGREGQRAYFIDQLLRRGKRGAYLVTGHRGVGKSNFVRYCLNEYEKEVFERFLQSSVGRVTFWDRILVMGLVAFLILTALILSELAELISLAIQEGGGARNILFWAVLTPLAVLCLYPALFAGEVLELVAKAIGSSRRPSNRGFASQVLIWLLRVAFFVALLVILWRFGPFGAPALSASRLLFALCAIALCVQSTSFRISGEQEWVFGRWSRRTAVMVVLLGIYVFFLPSGEIAFIPKRVPSFPLLEYRGNLGLSFLLAGMSCLLHGRVVRRLRTGGEVQDSVPLSYGRVGASLMGMGTVYLLYWGVLWALAVGIVLLAAAEIAFRKNSHKGNLSTRFSPQPLLALSFKAVLALVVCLQLLHPVAVKIPIDYIIAGRGSEDNRQNDARRADEDRICRNGSGMEHKGIRESVSLWEVPGLTMCVDGPGRSLKPRLEGWSIFHGPGEELRWLLCIFLSIAMLFFLEYEWLVRPFLRQRIDSAMDPSHVDSPARIRADRKLLRDLAEVTFPWFLFRAWLPVLVASVNLGFERLDHRRVVHAMLASLRAKYHRAFLAWNSLVANFGRLLSLLLLLLLVAIVGEIWFAMPEVAALDKPGRLRAVAKKNYREICTLFEGRQQGAGAVNLICKLKWGDKIFHILTYNLATAEISVEYQKASQPLLFSFFPYFKDGGWPIDQEINPPDQASHGPGDAKKGGVSRQKPIPLLFSEGVHIRVFHVMLFITFYLLLRLVVRRLPIFPYREAIKRIDEVIDQLSSTTSVTSTTGMPQPSNWLRGIVVGERVRQVQQDPWDPRAIEFIFLQILSEIQSASVVLPGGRNQLLSLPAPDITFVFDELDKLGSRVDPGPITAPESSAQQREIYHAERMRSAELHSLLADMKNLVSSAPARFVFVGGRSLHDEWLADQTARQPLLTNIFQTEVYLPSLLADYSRREGESMHQNVEEYIRIQARRARILYGNALRKEMLPFPSLKVAIYSPESFVPPAPRLEEETLERAVKDFEELRAKLVEILVNIRGSRDHVSMKAVIRDLQEANEVIACLVMLWLRGELSVRPHGALRNLAEAARQAERSARKLRRIWWWADQVRADEIEPTLAAVEGMFRRTKELVVTSEALYVLDVESENGTHTLAKELLHDFVQFLCYRSKGNPKRLKELLASFVRPVGRVIRNVEIREQCFDCEHVLMFDEVAQFRIQLLARVHSHLMGIFESHIVRNDDKLAMSVLYLADFLFKFHRRAFSWSNLERVDELMHIHRAPDLRDTLERLVRHWTVQTLHPIRNGMYDFRFLSEVAREIGFISRESQEEMAAFNFTLDESLTLKSVYESTIQRLSDERSRELQDLVAGLGELYEFDQEYETARFYYRRANSLLDQDLRQITGGSEFLEVDSPALEILGAMPEGQRNARLYMTWGIRRLRLMMQIGMTFELARNYEQAQAEYRNAYTLARSLLLAMLDETGRRRAVAKGIVRHLPPPSEERVQELKHLTLLFQPAFAEAWLGEKLVGAVDTSAALVERELWELRQILPFVREGKKKASSSTIEVTHSNFGLIMSDLHNKAGDLYFMKGRQLIGLPEVQAAVQAQEGGKQRTGQEGYLLQAHYHYCTALHFLRIFIRDRRESSLHWLNIWTAPDERWTTLSEKSWPAFVYSAAGEAFSDLGDGMVARVSYSGLLHRLKWLPSLDQGGEVATAENAAKGLIKICTEWLEGVEPEDGKLGPGKIPFTLPVQGHRISAGTLDGWLGTWRAESPAPGKWRDERVLNFDEWEEHDDETRLAVAINFMLTGAKYLERGGYLEDAAREYLKACEAISYYMWWGLAAVRLYEWVMVPEKDDEQLIGFRKIFEHNLQLKEKGELPCRAFWTYLTELGIYALVNADRLFGQSRDNELSDKPRDIVGSIIPPFSLTLACSLGLAAHHFGEIADPEKLAALLGRWLGKDLPDISSTRLREILCSSLIRHSYPTVNRLHGLMVLTEDSVLEAGSLGEAERSTRIMSYARELKELNSRFDAPMYFTPFSSGVAYGLAYIYCRNNSPDHLEEIRRAAQKDLKASEEMITLRGTYYDNISRLYYLYDDFNDRQLHFNHAIQMAGSELALLLKYVVNLQERRGRSQKLRSRPVPDSPTPPHTPAPPGATSPSAPPVPAPSASSNPEAP